MTLIERDALIFFATVPSIGLATLNRIRKKMQEWEQEWSTVFPCTRALVQKLGLTEEQQAQLLAFQHYTSFEKYREMLGKEKIQIITLDDSNYPQLLRQLSLPPLFLFCRGDPHLLAEKLPIAVVGTRRVTDYGEAVTAQLTRELVALNAVIVSGFMYGVDIIAHKTAMEMKGKSIAVLGFGFHHMYPDNHAEILEEFLAAGNLCLSEFPPSVPPRAAYFPLRNRIVAGLSLAIVVTEAAAKSGTFITVRHALDLGRTVCAVPGTIFSRYSDGTRDLINSGAVCVGSGRDVLAQLTGQLPLLTSVSQTATSPVHKQLLDHPKTIDELAQALQWPIEQVVTELSKLEIDGLIKKYGLMWVAKKEIQ